MKVPEFAFFDVDETLITIKSMFSFRPYYFQHLWGVDEAIVLEDSCHRSIMAKILQQGADRSAINRHFYTAFEGHQQRPFRVAAQKWYQQVRKNPGFFIKPILAALKAHQAAGTQVVFMSGSCMEIVEPLAEELDVKFLLVNRLEMHDGLYTGHLLAPQTIGTGKRDAVSGFLSDANVDAVDCWAYGDHVSDLPMLEAVGRPVVVMQDKALLEIARQRAWSTIDPKGEGK